MQYYSSKTVADMLDVSPSTIRLYAKKMEKLGYIFRKVNDAREFSNDDVKIFKKAQDYYQTTGGTIYRSLYYAKMEHQFGEDVANDEIDKTYVQESEDIIIDKDLNMFKKELLTEMEVCVKDKVEQSFNSFLKQIQDKADNTNVEKLMDEKQELIEENIKLREKVSMLQNRLSNIKFLSVKDFKNWKKD